MLLEFCLMMLGGVVWFYWILLRLFFFMALPLIVLILLQSQQTWNFQGLQNFLILNQNRRKHSKNLSLYENLAFYFKKFWFLARYDLSQMGEIVLGQIIRAAPEHQLEILTRYLEVIQRSDRRLQQQPPTPWEMAHYRSRVRMIQASAEASLDFLSLFQGVAQLTQAHRFQIKQSMKMVEALVLSCGPYHRAQWQWVRDHFLDTPLTPYLSLKFQLLLQSSEAFHQRAWEERFFSSSRRPHDELEEIYATLEIQSAPRPITDDQVRTAYRRLMRIHHPDKLSANPTAEMRQKQLEKAQKIQSAFNLWKQRHAKKR